MLTRKRLAAFLPIGITSAVLALSLFVPAGAAALAGFGYGGGMKDGPDAAAGSATSEDVFIRGLDDALWTIHVTGGSAGGWTSLGGGLADDPGSTSSSATRTDVFIRGQGNGLWHISRTGSTWSGWSNIPGTLGTGPDASFRAGTPAIIDVVAAGPDQVIYHNYSPNGGTSFAGWESLNGGSVSEPSTISWAPDRLDVFIRGLDNQLWHKYFTNAAGSWSNWEALGGILADGPDAASCTAGRLDVFVVGGDGAIYRDGWNGARWSGFGAVGAPGTVKLGVVCRPGTNLIDIFSRGADGTLQQVGTVAGS